MSERVVNGRFGLFTVSFCLQQTLFKTFFYPSIISQNFLQAPRTLKFTSENLTGTMEDHLWSSTHTAIGLSSTLTTPESINQHML